MDRDVCLHFLYRIVSAAASETEARGPYKNLLYFLYKISNLPNRRERRSHRVKG